MDAIVKAGGRGRRMGALTSKKQKGCLRYRGMPIIWHVLKTLAIPEISTIRVAMGYLASDLHQVLKEPVYRSGFNHTLVDCELRTPPSL